MDETNVGALILRSINSFEMRYVFLLLLSSALFGCGPRQTKGSEPTQYLGQSVPSRTPIVFGAGLFSVPERFDLGISISPDEKHVAFGVADPEETCIFFSRFEDGKWTTPEKTALPGNADVFFPMFDPSGDRLFFVKAVDGFETDLWVADFADGRLADPQPLDSIFNSKDREAGHGRSQKGAFYFTSNRDDDHQCCGDIYRSVGDGEVEKVEDLSSSADEESLFLSPDETFIIVQAWKNEFGTKHDLYISYQTKSGTWTSPSRLDSLINGPEIEQRPFVTADKQYLFFSRMSIEQKDGQDIYESDFYWVSTEQVFAPYGYNTDLVYDVRFEEPFVIDLPPDLFQDVDDEELSWSVTKQDGTPLPSWITFDAEDSSLSGTWSTRAPLQIKVIATDDAGNDGEVVLEIKGQMTNHKRQ